MVLLQEIISQKKINDGAYAINLDEYDGIGSHCVACYNKNDTAMYFDIFVIELFVIEFCSREIHSNSKLIIFLKFMITLLTKFMRKNKYISKYPNVLEFF